MDEIKKLKAELEALNKKKSLTSIEQRIKTSLTLQIPVFERISKLKYFNIALNGTEYTHPYFVENIRGSRDQTSLFIRFQPDGVLSVTEGKLVPSCAQIEVKASFNIEKDAFEQYYKLYNNGNIIIIVFKDFLWNFLEDIQFLDSNEIVGRYSYPHPVDENGWIYPRQNEMWYHHIKYNNNQASGTPYKEVDKSSLYNWDLFENLVKMKLFGKIEYNNIATTLNYGFNKSCSNYLNKGVYQNQTQQSMQFQF